MFFQNLSLLEFLGLLSAVSGVVVALYLLDRSKRKITVATLRFWAVAQQIPEKRHRKRIQQPWSLILQLVGIALLLLAIAQVKWGSRATSLREHVLIVDASAWMGARGRHGTLIDEAKAAALAYIRSLPPSDRIMVVRAEAFPAPLTGMATSKKIAEDAVRSIQPGAAALDLAAALSFAQRTRSLGAGNSGEIVFAGAGRHSGGDSLPALGGATFRYLPVEEPEDNCGLRQVGLRRAAGASGLWEVLVAVRNYGRAPRTLTVAAQFGNAPVASRALVLNPGAEQTFTFPLSTRAAGWLEVRLLTRDAFPNDDRVVLEIPPDRPLRVAIYTREPGLLRPLFTADPRLAPQFLAPEAWTPNPNADVIVLDRFSPPSPPALPSIWLDPPASGAPVRSLRRVDNTALTRWRSEHPLGAGLHTEDVKLENTQVFAVAGGDIAVAETPQGAAIVARPTEPRLVVFGFQPLRSAMRYQLATPLLFANILRWLSPESLRLWEVDAGAAGSRALTLDSEVSPKDVRVVDEDGRPLPFSIQGRTLRFYSAGAGTVHVFTPSGEIVQSLTLPEVPDARFAPPKNARRGVPRSWPAAARSHDLWPYLAFLGALFLLLEWALYGQPLRSSWQAPARLIVLRNRLWRTPERKAS